MGVGPFLLYTLTNGFDCSCPDACKTTPTPPPVVVASIIIIIVFLHRLYCPPTVMNGNEFNCCTSSTPRVATAAAAGHGIQSSKTKATAASVIVISKLCVEAGDLNARAKRST